MSAPEAAPHAGVVTALDNGEAVVRFQRSAMCAHCGACLAVGEKELEMRVLNTLGARVGDRVEVSIAGKRVLQASAVAYLVPLVLLLTGVWFGSRISDMAALLLGIAGCGAAFLALRLFERGQRGKTTFRPRMTAILTDEPGAEA